jgi:hypothetical protein
VVHAYIYCQATSVKLDLAVLVANRRGMAIGVVAVNRSLPITYMISPFEFSIARMSGTF